MFLPINLLKQYYKITSMTNSQFNPALPLPIKFNINDGKFGNQLTLCIPVESVFAIGGFSFYGSYTKPSKYKNIRWKSL